MSNDLKQVREKSLWTSGGRVLLTEATTIANSGACPTDGKMVHLESQIPVLIAYRQAAWELRDFLLLLCICKMVDKIMVSSFYLNRFIL